MNLVLDTAPAKAEILALLSAAQLKASLRISYSIEDALVEDSILEAYDWLAGVNGWLNRSVLTTKWVLKLPGFRRRYATSPTTFGWQHTRELILPKPPLVSIESVKYLSSGVLTTLDEADYNTVLGDGFGKIHLGYGKSWPTVDTHPEGVEIAYTAGYGDATAILEKHRALVKGLKLLAGDYFRNREDTYSDKRNIEVNRKIINGVVRVAGRYRLMNHHA